MSPLPVLRSAYDAEHASAQASRGLADPCAADGMQRDATDADDDPTPARYLPPAAWLACAPLRRPQPLLNVSRSVQGGHRSMNPCTRDKISDLPSVLSSFYDQN